MASAAEAELWGLFFNDKVTVDLREIFLEMGHPRNEPTPIQTDNSTAMGIANNTIKQRRSKVKDRNTQKHIIVYCIPGDKNLADYHTNFHSPAHHQKQRPFHVYTDDSPKYIPETHQLGLRGCVN